MRKFTLLLTVFYGSWFLASAQIEEITTNNEVITGKSRFGTIPLTGIINSAIWAKPDLNIVSTKVWNEYELDKRVQKVKNSYPAKKPNSNSLYRSQQISSINLKKGTQFDANVFDGSYPPDNTAAISKDGFIVSVTNSSISFSDTLGHSILAKSISSFINDSTLTDIIYDPDIIYDSKADRFYLAEVHGANSSTASILLLESKTGNPSDGWFYYKIPVNKNVPNEWADYPELGVSDGSIFITVNTNTNGGNFDQSVIYQVDKSSVLNGGTIRYLFWNNIYDNQANPPFTLVPATSVNSIGYGQAMYFVSISDGSGSNRIQVFYITSDINNSPQVIAFHVNVGDFHIGSNAIQPDNNSPELDVGDCRIKKAFFLNNIIHCVFTVAIDNSTGYNGIMYARINVGSTTVQTQQFGLNDRDIAYPSLAAIGSNDSDKSVIMFYEESGASTYPGTEAIVCDDGMNFNSPFPVKTGVACIKIDQNGTERWGDYSSIVRTGNKTLPEVWCFGTYGARDNVYGNNICELWNISPYDSIYNNQSFIQIRPNPFAYHTSVLINSTQEEDVQFDLFDSYGRAINHLGSQHFLVGLNKFDFTEKEFSSGLYFLVISSGKRIISAQKIVIQK